MLIIEEFQRLTEEIAVLESRITSGERELMRLARSTHRSSGTIKSIDYSTERVQGGHSAPELEDVVMRILELNEQMACDRNEIEQLKEQRAKLEAVIDRVGSTQKKVLMYKIEGLSHSKVATRMGCSKRYVERVYKEIRENLGDDYIKFFG